MNLRFNSLLSSSIFTLFMPIGLSLLLWQVLMIFFPLHVKEVEIRKNRNSLHVTSLSRLFLSNPSASTRKEVASSTKQNIKDIRLKALYEDENGGFVILEDKKERVFVSLRESYKGYVLESIETNFIVLSKNSKELVLYLDENKEKSSISTLTPPISESQEQIVKSIEREKLEPFQKDIKKIWRDIRLQPFKINSQFKGYIISYVKRGSLFEKMGLKRRDYIQKINGIDIKDNAKLMKLYLSMDTLESIHLEILRNQEPKELYYELN